jgi:hypothetical protein
MREWFTALATPLIALIGVYIAYQQHKLQRYLLKKDLFEKRWVVYLAVVKLLEAALKNRQPEIESVDQFNLETLSAPFLFDAEVVKYLEELRENYLRIWFISNQRDEKDFSSDEERKELLEELNAKRKWMRGQFDRSTREVFQKFLNFKEIQN